MSPFLLFILSVTILGSCIVNAKLGFDLSVATTQADWECLTSADQSGSFGLVRVYRNLGQVDDNAGNTIVAAAAAGLTSVDGYMFPCVTQSPYSSDHNITCDDANTQVKKTLLSLAKAGVAVKGSSLAPPQHAIKATIGRIWIDIEDEVPSKYFSSNTDDNIQFMNEISSSLADYGIEMGIYTTKTYWENIMANVVGYGTYKLWYPRYDETNNMVFTADTLPFADFKTVFIKQTNGDVGACGLSQVDSDYMEDETPFR